MNSFQENDEEVFKLHFESREVRSVAVAQGNGDWEYFQCDSDGNWECSVYIHKKPLHISVQLVNDEPERFRDILTYF